MAYQVHKVGNYPVEGVDYTITTTSPLQCLHLTGWWDVVHFSIAKKRVFVCTDCERILNAWDVKPAINEVR